MHVAAPHNRLLSTGRQKRASLGALQEEIPKVLFVSHLLRLTSHASSSLRKELLICRFLFPEPVSVCVE